MSVRSLKQSVLSGQTGTSKSIRTANNFIPFEYLVIGGGGGTAHNESGGGGAGGYRCSVSGELTGGGGSAETNALSLFGSFYVSVGAGGSNAGTDASVGSPSQFGTIIADGGGIGMHASASTTNNGFRKSAGGSSGGGTTQQANSPFGSNERANNPIQGNVGGIQLAYGNRASAGGGGAGGVGAVPVNRAGGIGGAGLSSSITLSSVTRGGGGGGSAGGSTLSTPGYASAGGGQGAGYLSGANTQATSGVANTGGGAGGGWTASTQDGKNGGSGLIVIRYPNAYPDLTVGAGLVIDNGSGGNVSGAGAPLTASFSNSTWKVYMFKSGTGTVSL
jgi:hypothetical protein